MLLVRKQPKQGPKWELLGSPASQSLSANFCSIVHSPLSLHDGSLLSLENVSEKSVHPAAQNEKKHDSIEIKSHVSGVPWGWAADEEEYFSFEI